MTRVTRSPAKRVVWRAASPPKYSFLAAGAAAAPLLPQRGRDFGEASPPRTPQPRKSYHREHNPHFAASYGQCYTTRSSLDLKKERCYGGQIRRVRPAGLEDGP